MAERADSSRQFGDQFDLRNALVGNQADHLAKLDEIAVAAFDDQCTGANPRFPLMSELKQILLDSYYGRAYVEGYDHTSSDDSDSTVVSLVRA